jgi:aminopeptidase N
MGEPFFRCSRKALARYEVVINPKAVRIGNTELPGKNHSFAFSARNPRNGEMPLMVVACSSAEPLPGLARKLPHYHKYSYLGFEGSEPVNVFKGRWPVSDSPMTLFVADDKGGVSSVAMGRLTPRTPLATLP